ncbi:F0F1 ATP synthase subunit B [Candidatus Peregrinibacteria bacterium]|nr:F0F1 ATP synthase subunit B [Candidatus Peregrinibacteria bacterium]
MSFIPPAFAENQEEVSLPVAENQISEAREKAQPLETREEIRENSPSEEDGGVSIQPSTVAFQALNFLILLILLHKILYKPLIKLLEDRAKRIREGVENAVKADEMLQSSEETRKNMLKRAQVESNEMIEKSRKAGEETREGIIQNAQAEAEKIMQSEKQAIERERVKTIEGLKNNAIDLVVQIAEKVLREKIDAKKDQSLIRESLEHYQGI